MTSPFKKPIDGFFYTKSIIIVSGLAIGAVLLDDFWHNTVMTAPKNAYTVKSYQDSLAKQQEQPVLMTVTNPEPTPN